MPARVIKNSDGDHSPKKGEKAPSFEQNEKAMSDAIDQMKAFSNTDRAQFYDGKERIELQGMHVQRVRELQEENDHLQREISAMENAIGKNGDPLSALADIEHRKIIIARNTGEILKIYLRNEERLKRVQELEAKNSRIQKEMMDMQGQFITTKSMDEKTKFASEFFILKAEIERNLEEIQELSEK